MLSRYISSFLKTFTETLSTWCGGNSWALHFKVENFHWTSKLTAALERLKWFMFCQWSSSCPIKFKPPFSVWCTNMQSHAPGCERHQIVFAVVLFGPNSWRARGAGRDRELTVNERDTTSFMTLKRKKNNVLIGLISDIVSMMIQIVSFQVFEEKSILLSSQHNHSHVFPMLCELVGDWMITGQCSRYCFTLCVFCFCFLLLTSIH